MGSGASAIQDSYTADEARELLGDRFAQEVFDREAPGGTLSQARLKELLQPVVLHWFPISQPSRSVALLLSLAKIPAEYKVVNLMTGEKCAENPVGAVPFVQDAAFGVEMGEGAAILIHLCETRGLSSFYPAEPRARARVNYWLHWNHTGARAGTHFLRAVASPPPLDKPVAEQVALLMKALPAFFYLDRALARQGTAFLAGDAPTIADLMIVPEVDQLDGFFDVIFKDGVFPNLEAWRKRMGEMPEYQQNVAPLAALAQNPDFGAKVGALKAAVSETAIPDAIKAIESGAADADGDGETSLREFASYLST